MDTAPGSPPGAVLMSPVRPLTCPRSPCIVIRMTKQLPPLPSHFTVAQLRKMRENATLAIGDARAARNRSKEMKFQQAITMIDSRLDELGALGSSF